MNGCALVFGLVVVGLLVLLYVQYTEREAARRLYAEALARLKHDPANPDLRETTLRRGRRYASLTRRHRGVAIFDEVALMNDINAACAAVTVQRQFVAQSAAGPTASIEDRLTRLHDLKIRGLISEAEYDERRRSILREV